jgi:hypothetical protein
LIKYINPLILTFNPYLIIGLIADNSYCLIALSLDSINFLHILSMTFEVKVIPFWPNKTKIDKIWSFFGLFLSPFSNFILIFSYKF